jgi:hypothetical protein
MSIAPLSLSEDYWNTLIIQDTDLELLYNHLLELEIPQTSMEMVRTLVSHRIEIEKENLQRQIMSGGSVYLPKNQYQVGQTLVFPALNWERGVVKGLRPGNNPELPPFTVLEISLENGQNKFYASGLENHFLNQPLALKDDDDNLNLDKVIQVYGKKLEEILTKSLEADEDLVKVSGYWFPRSLLMDINIGHLNIAEAILDMETGGPLSTAALVKQLDLPKDDNSKLIEFSLNLALYEDSRFDEVGPLGETIWFLKRLEPEAVQKTPEWLRFNPVEFNHQYSDETIKQIDPNITDELEPGLRQCDDRGGVVISLIYPHWRAGTLPLSDRLINLFPTAHEAPRILFTFVDGENKEKFPGWVVRTGRYVYGIREWYLSKGLIPGSLIKVHPGTNPGEIIIQTEKHRPTREYIRTVLIGVDGGLVFQDLRQMVTAGYSERMTTAIPDAEALENIWQPAGRQRPTLEETVILMIKELAKLNPQGHVHFEELYSSVNLVRRCPPGLILSMLLEKKWSNHLGDLYFRLNETTSLETANE